MSDQWYYVEDGETRGPISRSELKGLAQAGALKSTTLVWKDGMEDWVPASNFGLSGGPPPQKPPPLPKSPPPVPPPVSPAVAALPPPPARFTTSPSRPISRPVSQSNQQTGIIIAAGIALVAGLAIGWLGHAMFASPREKQIIAVAPQAPTAASAPRPQPEKSAVPVAALPAAPAKSEAPSVLPEAAPPSGQNSFPPAVATPTDTTPAESPPLAPTSPSSPAEASPVATTDPTSGAGPSPMSPAVPNGTASSSQTPQYVPKITLYQEIDVQRASKMPILETISLSQYQFLSQLEIGLPDAEGIRTVGQTVLDTRLLKADDLSQAQLADSLKKLKGWQFSYTLSKDGEVLKMMAGPADAPVAGKVAPKGTEGFIVTSVMDEAGWKELAQISFYVPDEQASGNKRHLRQMTHDFGPLGSFTGETSFVRKGMQQGLLRIDYSHKLEYRAPAKGAAIAGSPISVSGADLRPDIAGGSIWYDQKTKRVRQAEDHFHVKGEIATNIAPLGIEEQQAMTVKLTDVNPWSK